ncbi:hypothetical protein PIB30_075405 [Stylosanthes scabra]|uniref:GRF-type domain-containing protein n=1 Tax=Stylosanthes scabra TaxID=79078 RepID=A0ABU6QQI0_9FABA|nr:hypothetical protein [Stylosanthes scabra]
MNWASFQKSPFRRNCDTARTLTLEFGAGARTSPQSISGEMKSDDGSSMSRRSTTGGGGGGQRSSSTQCDLASTVGHERDGATPKCHCRAYAVLYLSKTTKNPHRLFFGCPFFKSSLQHCKFFLWLDQHAAKFEKNADTKDVKDEEDDVEEHFGKLKMENRVAKLEDRVSSIEKKSVMKMWLGCLFVCVVSMSVCVGSLK